jgi:hypothetical protein
MIELLILLLSTDWFLPHWTEIRIDIPQDKKICIQQGCGEIVDQTTKDDEKIFLQSFSDYIRQQLVPRFRSLLRSCNAEAELSVALEEWTNLSYKKRRAVWQCADLNYQIPSGDAAGIVAQLDFPIRAAVIKAWEAHPLEAEFLRDVCLSSTTEWDVRTRKLLVNPRVLANALWLALLDHRLSVILG